MCRGWLKELGVVEGLKDWREDVWAADVAINPIDHILKGEVRVLLLDVAVVKETPIDNNGHGGKVYRVVPEDLAKLLHLHAYLLDCQHAELQTPGTAKDVGLNVTVHNCVCCVMLLRSDVKCAGGLNRPGEVDICTAGSILVQRQVGDVRLTLVVIDRAYGCPSNGRILEAHGDLCLVD